MLCRGTRKGIRVSKMHVFIDTAFSIKGKAIDERDRDAGISHLQFFIDQVQSNIEQMFPGCRAYRYSFSMYKKQYLHAFTYVARKEMITQRMKNQST